MTIHKIKVNLAAFGNSNTPNGEHPVTLDGIPLQCKKIVISAAANEVTEVVITLPRCQIDGLINSDSIIVVEEKPKIESLLEYSNRISSEILNS